MPKEDFIQAMGDYHAPMGWDDWGYPSVEKLAGFDIEEYQKAVSPR